MNHFTRRCGCGQIFHLATLKSRETTCPACDRKRVNRMCMERETKIVLESQARRAAAERVVSDPDCPPGYAYLMPTSDGHKWHVHGDDDMGRLAEWAAQPLQSIEPIGTGTTIPEFAVPASAQGPSYRVPAHTFVGLLAWLPDEALRKMAADIERARCRAKTPNDWWSHGVMFARPGTWDPSAWGGPPGVLVDDNEDGSSTVRSDAIAQSHANRRAT